MDPLTPLPLQSLHQQLGARMAPFAGYEMPMQYTAGVMVEHQHTRHHAGLFDVSHMGQVKLSGPDYPTIARAAERLLPQDVLDLAVGRQRYCFFTDTNGGLLDDLMISHHQDHLLVVINAARKAHDIVLMRSTLEPLGVTVTELTDRCLLALQGPEAEAVLANLNPAITHMSFMDATEIDLVGQRIVITRSGYSGEDGFEMSVPVDGADALARTLLSDARVFPIGLAARDSLRLEAGLCLYGQDIDPSVTPAQADLLWAIQRSRRPNGKRAAGYPGANILAQEFDVQPERRRVGLAPVGRAPMRAGVALFLNERDQTTIGHITSGGFGPTVGHPIAMGYLPVDQCMPDTVVWGEIRGKRQRVRVVPLPFVPHRFKRKAKG